MKGVCPWLFRFYPASDARVSPVQNIFFPHCTLIQFMCPHSPPTLAGSRAGPSVLVCVSPGVVQSHGGGPEKVESGGLVATSDCRKGVLGEYK
jgi:hypothetical protein